MNALNMDEFKSNDPCDKLILAEGLGVRLIYCKNCNVIELEIGAISLRLAPAHVQQIANIMMKASLKLDRMINVQAAPSGTNHMQHLH